MSTTEVGVAYVRLLPSMDGFKADVVRELGDSLTKPAQQAGEDAGKAIAKGIEDGANGADLDGITSGIGDKLKLGLAAVGIAGGALLVEGLTSAMDLEATTDKLAAQLGPNNIWAESAGEIAGNLYKDGFGETVADTGEAVKKIIQAGLSPDLTDAGLEAITAKFLTFTDVLDQDMDMTVQSVQSMFTSGIAKSGEEALDVLTAGIQAGGDKAGDFAETFQEYSTNFREAGLSAADAAGLMVQGLDAGARDADKVADAIKEFGIRAQDGSKASAEGFAAIGLSAQDMTAKVAAGGPAAREALGQVLDGLRNIEDPAARSQAAVALFGTQAEDLGDALYALDLTTAADNLGSFAGSTEELGSAYDNASSKLESFKRTALMGLTEFIGGTVIPGLESLWDMFGPDVMSVLTTVGDKLTWVKDRVSEFWSALTTGQTEDEGTPIEMVALAIRDAWQELTDVYNTELKPAIEDLIAKGKELIEGVDWTTVWQELQPLLAAAGGAFMSFATLAITLIAEVVSNITSFINKVQELWQNHETFRTVVTAVWDVVSTKITTALNIISGIMQLVTAILQGNWGAAWDAIKRIVSNAWTSMTADIRAATSVVTSIVQNALTSITGWFRQLPGSIASAMSTVASAITNPFRSAFNSLKSLWNSTVGGFGFTVPSWIPGVGGKGFSIPKMHTGGIFDAPGGEGLALLKRGEGVFTPDQMRALGTGSATAAGGTVVELHADGLDRTLLEWLRRSIRVEGGGNVQLALGAA